MDRMTQLEEMAKEHGGVLKTSMAVSAGISKPTFALFLRKYGYQQVSAGIYCAPDAWIDELYLLQLRCPKTIFSHETALFLFDMTDREPLTPSVTAKTGYNPSHLTKAGVKVYTVKSELFELGKTTRTTPFGNTVATYNPERTICDIVRSRHSIDTQVFQDALKQYTRRRDKNLRQLMDYPYPFEYAAENGEEDKYRQSRKISIACKETIEKAIGDHYADNCLNTAAAVRQVVDVFGYDRTLYVLAVTVQHKERDGRISHNNKEWAKSVPVFADRIDGSADQNMFLVVSQAHPGLTDLFIRGVRKAQAQEKEQQAERAKSKAAEKPSILEKLKRPVQRNSPNNSANFLEPEL